MSSGLRTNFAEPSDFTFITILDLPAAKNSVVVISLPDAGCSRASVSPHSQIRQTLSYTNGRDGCLAIASNRQNRLPTRKRGASSLSTPVVMRMRGVRSWLLYTTYIKRRMRVSQCSTAGICDCRVPLLCFCFLLPLLKDQRKCRARECVEKPLLFSQNT